MRRIVTSLSPNAERDDVRLALRILFQPWRWQQGNAVFDLEHALGAFFRSEAVTFESGRSALTSALQVLDLPSGSEVILQAFTCVAVPNSVRWAGCVPVYADPDPKTFTIDVTDLDRLVSSTTRAILVQHTFGIPTDMDAVMTFAKRYNLFVIEDCAHSFGSRWNGQLLGTFGDVAIFSFGRDKALSSVFGGAAITRRKETADRLRTLQQRLPLPSFTWIAQQLLHPIVMAIALSCYDRFGLGKILLEIAKRLHLISKAVEREERKGQRPSWTGRRMANALATLALHQWKKRERFDAHRRHITQIYQTELDRQRVTLPTLPSQADPALLRFPIRTPRRNDVFVTARNARIQLGDWYTSPLAPEGVDEVSVGYLSSTTPEAAKLAQETLNLPTHIHMSEEDARRIVKLVNEAA